MLKRAQLGFSLVELMVAGALGLMLLSVLLSLYVASVHATAGSLQRARLAQELQAVLDIMTGDLRRAGYRAFDPAVDDIAANPFTAPPNDLRLGRHPGEPAASCITYSYDLNHDGRVGVGRTGTDTATTSTTNVEQLGFRLRDGYIEQRSGVLPFDCARGNWQAVTSPALRIDGLRFTIEGSCRNVLEPETPCATGAPSQIGRRVQVELGAHLAQDAEVRQTLAATVQVRNDRLLEAGPAP